MTYCAIVLMNRSAPDHPGRTILSVFQDLPLEFEPGSKWKYNNSGYYLLGMVVEEVSGTSYEEYLQQHVFAPLGMTQSY